MTGDAPGTAVNALSPDEDSRRQTLGDTRKPTVLVCDDALGYRVMLGAFLDDAGHAVTFGTSWDDSVARATAQQPDAMLVDLWMPTFTPHLLQRLHACSRRSVIVIVSAHAREESARAIDGIAGIAAVVSKRDHPETIIAAVSAALLGAFSRARPDGFSRSQG